MNIKADPYATKLHKRIDALLFVFILVVIAMLLRPAKGEMPLAITFSTVRPFWSTLAIFTAPADTSIARFQGQYDGVGAADRAALTALFSAPASSGFSPMMVVENHKSVSAVVADLDMGSHAKSFSAPSSLAPLSQISGYGSALTAESLNAPAFRTGTVLAGTDSRATSPALAGAIDASSRYAGEASAAPFAASTSSASSQVNQPPVAASINTNSAYALKADSAPTGAVSILLASSGFAPKAQTRSLSPNAISLPVPDAIAATYTWDGGGADDNWGTGANWNPDGAPAPSSTNDLNFAGTTRLTPNNNYGAFDDFRNITFVSGAGSFSITGNSLDIFGKIENLSTNTQTFGITSFSMNSASGSELNPVNGDLTISTQSIFSNGNTIHVYGNNGKTLTINNTGGSGLTGTGKLVLEQNSNVILNGSNNYTGNTEINAGTLDLRNNNAVSGTPQIYVGNGGTTSTSATLVIGSGGVTIASGITVNAGNGTNRTVGGTNTTGTSTYSGAVSLAGVFGENRYLTVTAAAGGTIDFTGQITGSGQGIYKVGDGIVKLSNTSNSFGGSGTTVNINAGTLSVPASGALGSTSNTLVFNGGTLQFTNASGTATSTARSMTFNSTAVIDTASPGTTVSSAVTFSGALSGAGGLTKTGTGMLIVSGTSNNYAGATTVNGGTLRIGATNSLPTGTNLVVDSANSSNFDLNGLNQTVAQLSNGANGGGIVTNQTTAAISNSILTVTGTSTFGGVIQNGTGTTRVTNLTKSTGGTLTLTGANTYTGATLISGGTLSLDNNNTTTPRLVNTSGITVNTGGTLLLTQSGGTASSDRINNAAAITLAGGTFRLSGVQEGSTAANGVGALTLTSNSIIDLASTSLLHLAASNAINWNSNTLSIYNWTGTPTTGGGAEQILFGSNNTALTSTQLNLISFYSDSGSTFLGMATFAGINNGEIVPLTPVPEPSTWTAAALALGAIAWTQRRRFAFVLAQRGDRAAS